MITIVRKRMNVAMLLMAAGLFVPMVAAAKTVPAASVTLSAVQAAINAAADGDTVLVPAGTATWNGSANIPETKRITLMGAGIGKTIITRSTQGDVVLSMGAAGSRCSGFEFRNGYVEVDGDNFRFDHNKITFANVWVDGIDVRGNRVNDHPTGVIDHNVFHNMRIVVRIAYLLTENDSQHWAWAQPTDLGGTSNTVFIEDNTFTGSDFAICAVDANYGGAFVFRHNTLTDIYIEFHSVQGDNRAGRKWEIYENTINQKTKAMWVPMFIRGGSGVIFNNTFTGSWGNGGSIALNNVRDTEDREVCGTCDGSSNWDGNVAGQGGWPCRDQIGRGRDLVQWDGVSAYNQAAEPAYIWNNRIGSTVVAPFVHNEGATLHIKVNRDYYLTQKPGYTPYTYPHPMVSLQDGTGTPAAPSNLRVTSP